MSIPKTYASTRFLLKKHRKTRSQTVKKSRYFGLQNIRFHTKVATRTLLDARLNQKPGCVRKDALQLRSGTLLNNLFMNRQDACSTRDKFSCGRGILPVLKNSARCELQPAEPLKNPVSLILVHHIVSGCSEIIKSSQQLTLNHSVFRPRVNSQQSTVNSQQSRTV